MIIKSLLFLKDKLSRVLGIFGPPIPKPSTNIAIKYIIFIFIITCSLFFWVHKDLRLAQETFFQLGGTAVVLISLFFLRDKLSRALGIFGLYAIILVLLNGCKYGADIMLNIFIGFLIYYVCLGLRKEDTKLVLTAVVWVCIANMIYMALQSVGFDFIYVVRGPGNTSLPDARELIGFMGLKSVMGMIMGLGAIATFLINPWLSLAYLIPIYISKSSGVILGIGLAVPFYFWYIKRKAFYIITPLLIIGAVAYVFLVDSPMGMMKTRPAMWKIVLKDTVYGFNIPLAELQSPYLSNPLTGFGIDSFRKGNLRYFKEANTNRTIRGIVVKERLVDVKGRFFTKKDGLMFSPDGKVVDYWDNPHNSLVRLFFEFGLIGYIIVGFIFYALWEGFYNSYKTDEVITITAMLIFLVGASMTQFPECLGRIGHTIPILLGLFGVNTKEE